MGLADPSYYLTLFKLEGHETWRAFLGTYPDSFEKQLQKETPKVTEKNVLKIDRINGTIKPI